MSFQPLRDLFIRFLKYPVLYNLQVTSQGSLFYFLQVRERYKRKKVRKVPKSIRRSNFLRKVGAPKFSVILIRTARVKWILHFYFYIHKKFINHFCS